MVISITDLSHPALAPYTSLTQNQLRNRLEPEQGLFIAESPKVIDLALRAGFVPQSFLMEERKITGSAAWVLEQCPDVPVYTGPREVLEALTGYTLTRGVLCAMARKPLPQPEEICAGAHRVAVLENIVDATNVGAIFRSAAALHMDAVLVSPSCCDPLCRRSIRVSMGTVFQVPWARLGEDPHQWPQEGLARLKAMGFATAALALTPQAKSIEDPALAREDRLAIFLGSEGDGLSSQTIAQCDHTVIIPMSHQVDSLNVAAASAVAFWQLRKR